MVPSGDSASATTGASCPSSTLDGCGSPGVQIAIRAFSPPGAVRPARRKSAAVTAPSLERTTCAAVFLDSDQRITDVSKLPETACVPSGEIASARTGPPWPRNCACATVGASNRSATRERTRSVIAELETSSGITWLHAQGTDFRAHRLIPQRGQKGPDGRALTAAFDQEKVVVFRRDGEKGEPVELHNRLNGDSPVPPALRPPGGNPLIPPRLIP